MAHEKVPRTLDELVAESRRLSSESERLRQRSSQLAAEIEQLRRKQSSPSDATADALTELGRKREGSESRPERTPAD